MEWKIERIRDRCATCAKVFTHEQRVISAIATDEQQRAVRRDLCGNCVPAADSGVVWWETRFQEQEQKKKKKVDFDRLLRVFEAWQKSPPLDSDSLRYLITLLLVRKRFLKLIDLVSEEGREFLRLRRPGPTEQWYLTPAPLLTPADLPPLRARLEELIDGSFDEVELPTASDTTAATS
ncbi:MAG: hypothetical protein EXS13_02080 [Planctomycetes bacterium]|nr:hypothetical protein [Planctomycetota bacterium]